MCPITLSSPLCSSCMLILGLQYSCGTMLFPMNFLLTVSLCSVPCFLLYSLHILRTSSFLRSPPTQFCCLQLVFPCTFSFVCKDTQISQFCEIVASVLENFKGLLCSCTIILFITIQLITLLDHYKNIV